MRTFKLLIIVSVMALSSNLYAQSTGNTGEQKQKLLFTLIQKYPVNVVHKYFYRDSMAVKRTFSDSSVINYLEDKVTYISQKAPNRRDSEGYIDIQMSMDSLYYTFQSNKDTIEYNTQWDEGRPPFSFNPFMASIVPIGKDFLLKYSPYDEIVSIRGDRYERQLKRLTSPKTGIKDSLQYHLWVTGQNILNLSFLTDVNKNILPETKASKDTTWIALVPGRINGVHFIDSVKMKIVKYNTKKYTLEGESIGKTILPLRALIYRINHLINVNEIIGNSHYHIELTPRGAIEKFEINHNVKIEYQFKNDIILENIVNKQNWVLTDRFNF